MGDGTRAFERGAYTLRDVRLPERAGEPGRLSFVIESYQGRPQKGYLTEQSKKMHVYVVREDLAVFRHVHPVIRPDGTWAGNLTLPEPGEYRLVAEFVARDAGRDGDHVLLGAQVTVPGPWRARPVPPVVDSVSDWGVEVTVLSDLAAGEQQKLRVRLETPDGTAPILGKYLGASAHLTGFHVDSGATVHMHPLGAPRQAGDESVDLLFHAELPEPGGYVLFLQVRVEGFLHTLRVPVAVS